jgi:hypothetical protein
MGTLHDGMAGAQRWEKCRFARVTGDRARGYVPPLPGLRSVVLISSHRFAVGYVFCVGCKYSPHPVSSLAVSVS